MTKKRKLKLLLCVVILFISCFLTCFANNVTYASSIDIEGGYSNVLEDLQKDENFDASKYPVVADDYSLNVMHIAESQDRELLIYVYQPCGENKKIVATSLFLSTNVNGLDYKNYSLNLLNKQGVFYKYSVKNFAVSNEATRHYEITSIYRAFDSSIDKGLEDDNGNIINEVEYPVAKHWTFGDNEIICHDIETIKITDKYVGFCRYDSGYTGSPGLGFSWQKPGYDSHFVAFNTDRKIDELYEADVYFSRQSFSSSDALITDESCKFGDVVDDYAYLKGESVIVDIPNGGSGTHFEWETIQTVDEFFECEDREFIYEFGVFNVKKETKLTDEGKKDIEGMSWVLRFALTEFNDYYEGSGLTKTHYVNYTIVGSVSILRLKFLSGGVVYDLGVIDNKQQGDGIPDNYTETTLELKNAFKIILAILLLIVVLVVLAPILPTIFGVIWSVVKVVFKFVWWVISAPFKLFGKAKKKRK